MSFSGVADIEVDVQARAITIDDRLKPSPETLRHLLHDQIWPRILAHEGAFVLHGAGVTAAEEGILLVAASRSGKSTLAASLHKAGYPLMGDDAMILTDGDVQPTMRAVYRSLRLFADSVRSIVGPDAQTSPVADYIEKWNVDLPGVDNDRDVPVRAIFLLDPAPAPVIEIEAVPGAEGAFALVEQSFTLDPSDPVQAAGRLRRASAIAEQVAVLRLRYPRDYDALPRVHAAMIEAVSADRPRAEAGA